MRIKKIHIQNYKSLVDFELDSPPPFCAFVGPNASGKSNIFEALEFSNYVARFNFEAANSFKGKSAIFSYNPKTGNNSKQAFHYRFDSEILIDFDLIYSDFNPERIARIGDGGFHAADTFLPISKINDLYARNAFVQNHIKRVKVYGDDYEQFIDRFSRIFVGRSNLVKNPLPNKLVSDASNLSQIIGQIFQDENKKQDFIEWLQILIPEFKNIEVKKSNIDGSYEFFVYEESSDKPFPKHLISDGTYNILSLLAAVYQSSEPQFLCIEEPENGLHPEAIQLLVDFFREKSEEEGHHIWLNSHSQTLVRCMEKDEIILVNKINGETRAKRVTNLNDVNIKTDEAWLTNALGGGVSWSK